MNTFTSFAAYIVRLSAGETLIKAITRKENGLATNYVDAARLRELDYADAGTVDAPLDARNLGVSSAATRRWSALDKTRMSKGLKVLRAQWVAVQYALGLVSLVAPVEGDDENDEDNANDALNQARTNYINAVNGARASGTVVDGTTESEVLSCIVAAVKVAA